ncbi:hypothetical protein BC332_28281 [Capsicum chinense]|nr:hypothetical protein BC332_28281 [Capsicum chinense]
MLNSRVVKPKPRYEDLMDACIQEYNPVTTGIEPSLFAKSFDVCSTDDAANIAQAIAVHQQSERTAPTEFGDEFNDFSTPPSVGLLKKMRLDTGQSSYPPVKKQKIVKESEKVRSRVAKSKQQSDKLSKDKNLADSSIDRSEPRVSLDKDNFVPNVKMRDADKAPAASEENLSLSKSYLDDIKSYVRTYVDIKFNDLQKLMVDQYTGLLGVVKEDFASFGKVAQYPVHKSEKGNPNIEVDPPQSANEHTTDAKSYNIVDAAGQSFKLGVNEGATEESLKKAESLYVDKLQEDDRHITDAEVVEVIMKERVRGSIMKMLQLLTHVIGKETLIVNVILATAILQLFLSSHVENIRSMKVASVERSICEIMYGLYISTDIPWHLIDEVYMPINCKGSFHWVLVVIVLKERCIRVYDWMKGHRAYAEFLSDRHQIPSPEFDSKKHRTRYTSLLRDYGVNKACTGYVVTTKIRLGLNAPLFDLRIQR